MTKTTLTAAFSQMVHTVDKAFPSLFTKEDVIVVLKDLEEQLEAAMNGNEEETTTKINCFAGVQNYFSYNKRFVF